MTIYTAHERDPKPIPCHGLDWHSNLTLSRDPGASCPDCIARQDNYSLAYQALLLAQMYGTTLDADQAELLIEGMRLDDNGHWLYTIVCDAQARQNGKNETIEVRSLYGARVLGEEIYHTAHEAATAINAFNRAETKITEDGSIFKQDVARVRYANGEQGIPFLNGGTIDYRTRTAKAGRGLDGKSLLIMDEAQNLTTPQLSASSSVIAVPRTGFPGQRWIGGSGGLATSVSWWGLREEGVCAVNPSMLWHEHTAELLQFDKDGEPYWVRPKPDDQSRWEDANIAIQHGRMTMQFLRDEYLIYKADPEKGVEAFAREHLCVWDPLPNKVGAGSRKLKPELWATLRAPNRDPIKAPFYLGVCASSTGHAVIAAQWVNKDTIRVERIVSELDNLLLTGTFKTILANQKVAAVMYDSAGYTSTFEPGLREACAKAKVKMVGLSNNKLADACEGLTRRCQKGELYHLGDTVLANAVVGSGFVLHGKKGAWMWDLDRTNGAVIGALTLAVRLIEESPKRTSAYAGRRSPVVVR